MRLVNKTRFAACVAIVLIIIAGINYELNNQKKIDKLKKENTTLSLRNDGYDRQKEEYKNVIEKQSKHINKIKTENDLLIQHNMIYENTIKEMMTIGKRPQHYRMPEKISRGTYLEYRNKMKYVGKWVCTFYAPTKEECSNDRGITASGKPVTPGITAAIDPRYWKFGTKIYIEGYGIFICEDTGSAIKGRERVDLCTLSTDISHSGSFKVKVYVISE